MTEYMDVTWRNLKPGQEIHGYKKGNARACFVGYVKSTSIAGVVVELWNIGSGKEEHIDTDAIFQIEMTREDLQKKYFNKAKEIMQNIQVKLHYDEIGSHDMWNAWLDTDPYDMAQTCCRHDLTVVGYCTDIVPKTALFTGQTLDIGVCVQDADGERFWCHSRKEYIDFMIENYPELIVEEKA